MKTMYINGDLLKLMFERAAAELSKKRELVNALNVFPVPDGDTGTNMSLTMNSAVEELGKSDSKHSCDVAKVMAKGLLMGARGNSGVILSQIFRGFAKGCEDRQHLSSIDFAKAMKISSDTAYKAVMKPVEGTILTVIRKTGDKAMEFIEEEIPIEELLEALIERAEEILAKTPEYLEVLKQAGVVDAGGMGLLLILKGFKYALTESGDDAISEYRESHMGSTSSGFDGMPSLASSHAADIEFGYCTEFIVRLTDERPATIAKVKDEISSLGDSFVFVEDDDIVKVHIHTNNPGKAMESALSMGDLVNIKIENMRDQHSALVVSEKEKKKENYSVIAVSMGEGLSNIFIDLGVDHVIEGGQTMNPSTEDIMKAINGSNAENIIILPNNSNIILAANQAKELSDKNVFVVPTKTVPEGIAAMIEFDQDEDPKSNSDTMIEAANSVKTVQVTYSVRDTVFDDKSILAGDILGITGGDISVVGKDMDQVLIDTLKNAMDDDSELITVYYGNEIDSSVIDDLRTRLEDEFEGKDVEVYFGGQPIYYYICSVE